MQNETKFLTPFIVQRLKSPLRSHMQASLHKNSEDIAPFKDLDDDDIASIFPHSIYRQIIDSNAFQRLKEIRFLGAIDYLISPNGSARGKRHTRFQHSLRVGQLAIEYARLSGADAHMEAQLAIAGLLHDIGHAPLSHSLEPSFKDRFGLNHHDASEMIILGNIPLGSQLPAIFKKHGILATNILALIEGTSPTPFVEAFKNPINIDTIEAITRSYTYLNANQVPLSPLRVVAALVNKGPSDVAVLDEFWHLKDLVYNQLISSKFSVLADFVCRKYMTDNELSFWKGSYLQSEPDFRKKHGKLFALLRDIKARARGNASVEKIEIAFKRRHFVVDDGVGLYSSDDMYKRYKQTRSPEKMQVTY